MGLLNFIKRAQIPETQMKLAQFGEDLAKVVREIKDLRESLEKLEIKALESRKVYYKKLKALVGDDEKSESNINKNVLLGPNGAPIIS